MRRYLAALAPLAILASIFVRGGPTLTQPRAAVVAATHDSLQTLRDLSLEVSAGRRSASDLRTLALEAIEPSAYAAAVTGYGLGAYSGKSSLVSTWRIVGQYNTGQSLSTAFDASPCLSTTQPFANVYVCDSTGVYPYDAGVTSTAHYSWAPYSCGVTCTSAAGIRNNAIAVGSFQYPANITQNGESNSISAANTRTWLALAEGYGAYTIAASDVGIAGVSIDYIVKNGTFNAYAAGLFEVAVNTALTAVTISSAVVGSPTVLTTSAAHLLTSGNKVYITGATGMTELNGYYAATVIDATHFSVPVASTHAYTGSGKATSYGMRAALWTQGEADAIFLTSVTSYKTQFTNGLLTPLQSDVAAIDGQTEAIQWYATQQNSTIGGIGGGSPATAPMVDSNTTAEAVYELEGTSNFHAVGPKYQWPYCSGCGPHESPAGQRLHGEKTGEAIDAVDQVGTWHAVKATHAAVTGGTTVVVTHQTQSGCLAFSGSVTPPHQSGVFSNVWANSRGFEPYDNTGLTVSTTTGNGVSPIVYTMTTSIGSKITTGDYVCVGGSSIILGNTAANACGQATVSGSTLSLAGTTGNGAYGGVYPGNAEVLDLLPVTSATITSCNQVTLVLGRAAVTQLTLEYAMAPDTYFGSILTGEAGCGNGGACGLLIDSDAFTASYSGASGLAQPNYALAFENQSIPF